jgi:protein gp37
MTLRRTSIEWTDYSWNPIRARAPGSGKIGWHCEHVSEECRLCYAEVLNKLYGTRFAFTRQNRDAVELYLDEKILHGPMPRRPAKIFVCDMTDLFGQFVPDEWIDHVISTMTFEVHLTFQVLTKRPERMREYFTRGLAVPHLWIGTSVGQRRHLSRLDELRNTFAAVRFVSFEPLLEDLGEVDLTGIDWVIVGAESGNRARAMQLDWVRRLRNHCIERGIAFFFKQDARRGKKLPLPELDGRQWREFPRGGERP